MNESRKKRSSQVRGRTTSENHHSRGPNRAGKMSSSKYQRQSSDDHVRKIVQAEGREARNLITWSVPVDDENSDRRKPGPQNNQPNPGYQTGPTQQQSQQQHNNNRHHNNNNTNNQKPLRSRSASGSRQSRNNSQSSRGQPQVNRPNDLPLNSSLDGGHLGSSHSGHLGSSHGSVTTKKGDLRARYWAFLFDNLRRAVDEIYTTCEADESVVECKEVLMMLERCTKDFNSLIERLKLLKDFENADADKRPTSLAWELRKSSPGKALGGPERGKDFAPSPTVARSLNFNLPPQVQRQPQGHSWADRVKGTAVVGAPRPSSLSLTPGGLPGSEGQSPATLSADTDAGTPELIPLDDGYLVDDSEGWETVQRNSRAKRPLSAGGVNNINTNNRHSHRHLQQTTNSQNAVNKSHYQRSKSLDPSKVTEGSRPRTNSHDSEKENLPENPGSGKNLTENSKNQPEIGKNLTKASSEKNISTSRSGKSPWAIAPTINISKPSKPSGDQMSEDPNKLQDPSIVAQGPATSERQTVNEEERHGNSTEEQRASFSQLGPDDSKSNMAEELEDGDDTADDDEYQINSALASALEEEDSLSSALAAAQEEALESAIMEEESYLQEIAREESLGLDVEETDSDLGNTASTSALGGSLPHPTDWDSMVQQFEADAEGRGTMSWGDMVEDAETRTPGRVVHMHEKLSSPSRKNRLGSPTESRKRYEEKQAKAQELREKLLQEKSERLKTLTSKVEEVRAWKDDLLEQRRVTMERKLQNAEDKRQLQLKLKVRKAHEEENKANEIAFINTLEAQNKRHDIFIKYQESEARLQDIQEERQRKHTEKLAKEAAVEERRRVLEADRRARLEEIQQRRRHKEEVISQRAAALSERRQETARAKERDREGRIAALNAQQQAHIETLQKKIQTKQEESDRRHREQLGHIMEKAFSMSILQHSTGEISEAPTLAPYETQKVCTVCKVMIPSEVHLSSHLRGKKHQQALSDSNNGQQPTKEQIEQFNLSHISDAPKDNPDPRAASERERHRALKKRCKKLRQRMALRGTEYDNALSGKQQTMDSDHRAKLQKVVKDLNKYLTVQDQGPWPQNKVSALDRGLGELQRVLDRKVLADQTTFRLAGGLTTLSRILLVIGSSTADLPTVVPHKSLILCASVFRAACKGCYDNCHYMLFSNKIGSLVDMLSHQLNLMLPDQSSSPDLSSSGGASGLRLTHDPLVTSLTTVLATILTVLAKHNPAVTASEKSAERTSTSGDAFMSRASDIVSYLISVGILDKLTKYFNNVRGPIDSQPEAAEYLQHSLGLLIAMIRAISRRPLTLFDTARHRDDPTQLIATFEVTGLVGIVSLMYGMLLHNGAPSRGDQSEPPELPQHSITVATMGFRMLNHLAALDLQMLQASLGEEGTSLEFRHIASYLLWYCSHWPHEELLHEVILCVGYFTVLHPDNQVIIQSGHTPTVLQQLCSLPFSYFSDPRLTSVLFPTLIACCYGNQRNREILEQELSCALLANFIEEKSLEAQTKQSPPTAKKSKSADKDPELRMSLACRFPTKTWTTAQEYFKTGH